MDDLLLEIGCEDLPAGSMLPMARHLLAGVTDMLTAANLLSSSSDDIENSVEQSDSTRLYATPRRIAVYIRHVGDRQPDVQVEKRGPAISVAYKDGQPTPALTGFLQSAGVTVDDVDTLETEKGAWVVVRQKKSGKSLAELLNDALPDIIKNMPMPRRMRWGYGTAEFLRPVVWLLALHGEAVLPVSVLGLNAARQTWGHRFHMPGPIDVAHPSRYESLLEQAKVVADPVQRKARIQQQVLELARSLNSQPVMDEELLDEVTALVEWPVALAGQFEEIFLEIPKEALIQTMQENQRYFALLDGRDQLLPAFITVANLESTQPSTVIDGNERVIRPRFADTKFFWDQDEKKTLQSHQSQLSRILFQEKLGSVADKVQRMDKLGAWLNQQLSADAEQVSLAISLCKCDLNTQIVMELPKMQGICGRYYAERDNHPQAVADAMEQHYYPKHAGGALPTDLVSQIVSLADKIDTIVGIYGLGMKPSGTRDPYGLRRASIGIVRIIIECRLDLDLGKLVDKALEYYADLLVNPDRDGMLDYIQDRMRGYLSEQGYARDAIEAVFAKQSMQPLDVVARLQAVESFRQSHAAVSLSAASKRMANLLRKNPVNTDKAVNSELLRQPAERQLYERWLALQPTVKKFIAERDYGSAMRDTASIKDSVDQFFDDVMVMDKNEELRNNRLALINHVNQLCCETAEISLLTLTTDT